MTALKNLSKKEKNLLLFLLVVIAFYVSYSFVIQPSKEKREGLLAQQAQIEAQLQKSQELIEAGTNLEKEIADKKIEIEDKYGDFLKSLDQAQILAKMEALINEANFPLYRYTTTEQIALQVPIEKGLYEALKYPLLDQAKRINEAIGDEEEQGAGEVMATEGQIEDMIESREVSLSFENASYDSVYQLIESIEHLYRTIQLKELNIYGNGDLVRGEMVFAFYGLPSIHPEKMVDYPLIPFLDKGKTNPFV